jgi:hypothetical protein
MSAVSLIASLALVCALDGTAVAPAGEPATAAIAPAPKEQILGVWKGSSICTKVEGNEFCRDETVVYNFVDIPDQPQTVGLKAGRVVDDSVQPMYELYFTYRPGTGDWSCEFSRPKFTGVWTYVVHGDDMTGTATLTPSQKVVRNVSVKRTAKEQVVAH